MIAKTYKSVRQLSETMDILDILCDKGPCTVYTKYWLGKLSILFRVKYKLPAYQWQRLHHFALPIQQLSKSKINLLLLLLQTKFIHPICKYDN